MDNVLFDTNVILDLALKRAPHFDHAASLFALITLFRDKDGDGQPDMREVFLENLNQPFGMLILRNRFVVGDGRCR